MTPTVPWRWGEEENLKLRSIMSRESVDYHSGEWLIAKLSAALAELRRLEGQHQALVRDNARMRKELTRDDRARRIAAGVARNCAAVFGSMGVACSDVEALIADRMDFWLTPGPTTPVATPDPAPGGAQEQGRESAKQLIGQLRETLSLPRCPTCGAAVRAAATPAPGAAEGPQFTLCEDTAMLAVDGACPAHGGDACLREFVPLAPRPAEGVGEAHCEGCGRKVSPVVCNDCVELERELDTLSRGSR